MGKNLPANAGDTGSTPGPGRYHKPSNNEACELQLLSLNAATTEPEHLEPVLHNKRSHRYEELMTKSSPCLLQLEKAHAKQQRPSAAKKKKKEVHISAFNSKCITYDMEVKSLYSLFISYPLDIIILWT